MRHSAFFLFWIVKLFRCAFVFVSDFGASWVPFLILGFHFDPVGVLFWIPWTSHCCPYDFTLSGSTYFPQMCFHCAWIWNCGPFFGNFYKLFILKIFVLKIRKWLSNYLRGFLVGAFLGARLHQTYLSIPGLVIENPAPKLFLKFENLFLKQCFWQTFNVFEQRNYMS